MTATLPSLAPLIDPLLALARGAGEIILRHYAEGVEASAKPDNSPVTVADREADAFIVAGLRALTPQIPVVSEEGDKPEGAPLFWLVDPLDGTRSFLARDGQFTVNIALVFGGEAVLGVMGVPVEGSLYWAHKGGGAFRMQGEEQVVERIFARAPHPEGMDVVSSKSHASPGTDRWLERFAVRQRVKAGSALKLLRVAEGAADLYPRLGPTMEWDIAAGQCILEEAGGVLVTLEGGTFHYGKPGFVNGGFVASGRSVF